jgi:RHS repeat-associated protein
VTSLTPPGRPAHTFTYTPVDLTSSYIPPTVSGTGTTGYLFNVDRQPTEIQRPDAQTTTFTYSEPSGRLMSAGFWRNGQAATLEYGYDTAGRVNTLNDSGGVNLAFTYDGVLPLSETWSGGVTGSVARTFTNHFELNSESVNGANAVTFGYDDDRLLTSAGALTITRDATNGLVTETALGSTLDTHQYNTFGEPTRQTSTFNTAQLFDVQIARDNLGRITQRIEAFPEITRTFHYAYDLAGRLQTVTRDGVSGQVTVAAYTYDANGNRLTAEGEAYGGGAPIAATYDNQDRLLTYGNGSYTYTANGELASKTVGTQTTSYVYDTLGNLISVTKPNGDVITYTIDGRGRRVGKSINGTRVKSWLYADQLRPSAEFDGNGNLVSRFVYGTKPNVPEYIIRNSVTYRVFSDHLGSPRVIANVADGTIVQRMDFHPFGEILQDSNPGWQPFGFAGGLYDNDSGLIRFGSRDFDPVSGRWTAKDPILFLGDYANLYAYVAQDPINAIDPSGLEIFPRGVPLPSKPQRSPFDIFSDAARLASISGLPGPSNGPQDAYRHCLASCMTTKEVGPGEAAILGWANEVFGHPGQESGERAMDDRNNACGRAIGKTARSTADCESGCRNALSAGRLQSSYTAGTTRLQYATSNLYRPRQ